MDLFHLYSPFHVYRYTEGRSDKVWILEPHPHPLRQNTYRVFWGRYGSRLTVKEFTTVSNELATKESTAKMYAKGRKGYRSYGPAHVTHDRILLEEPIKNSLDWAADYPEWDDGLNGIEAIRLLLKPGEQVFFQDGKLTYKKSVILPDDQRIMLEKASLDLQRLPKAKSCFW